MKQKELKTLIAGGENEGLEFKSAFGDPVIEALVAFANTSGGKVLVGVDDRGNIPGITIGKETIPQWLNEIKQKTGYKGTEKSIPRNIKVAEIFKEAFLIERYGSGIKRAVKELTDYKLPVPKIIETAGGIEIVIYGTPQEKKEPPINGKIKKSGGINGGIKEIGGINGGINTLLEYIKSNPGKKTSEISSILQITERTLERRLNKLKKMKKITYKGSKKKGGYYAI